MSNPDQGDFTSRCKLCFGFLRANATKIALEERPLDEKVMKELLNEDISSESEDSSTGGARTPSKGQRSGDEDQVTSQAALRGEQALEKGSRGEKNLPQGTLRGDELPAVSNDEWLKCTEACEWCEDAMGNNTCSYMFLHDGPHACEEHRQ